MRTRRLNSPGATAAMLLVLASSACAPVSAMDDIGRGSSRNTINGEVRSVDTRRARIEVREEYGRSYAVRYDNRTQVVYGQRRYPVSSLERGDLVTVRLTHDRGNELWADRIVVRDSRGRSDRDDRYGTSVQRYDGTVRNVDTRRGFFTLERSRGASLIVHVPRDARRDDIRRFERLRRNDRVRVEVRVRGNGNQGELVRFR